MTGKNGNFKQMIKITDRIQPLESLSKKPQVSKIIVNFRRIKRKIMIMSGKSGVGKSTLAKNRAIGLALRGYKVGLLDCDIHGPTIPTIFGLESERLAVNEKGILPIKVRPNLSGMSIVFLLENKDPPSSGRDLQK
jgi:ATP-binding protein involved in chromosome partitioning